MPDYKSPRYKPGRTVSRPITRFKCRWVPRRTTERKFTAQDAARVICYAINQGANRPDIVRRSEIKCPVQGERPKRADEVAQALELAIEMIQGNNEELVSTYNAFLAINGILLGVIALTSILRIATPLRVVQVAARASQVQVAALITRNITQRAANDSAFVVIRRALDAWRSAA